MRHISHNDVWCPGEVASLARQLPTRTVGKHIHLFDSVASTNDIALQLAHDTRWDGAVVLAETQTRGRGRRERMWLSPRGGLWMSVVFCPAQWPAQPPLLALLSSAPTAQAIEDITGLNVQIKWPNDLRIGGRKVAGILGEMQLPSTRVSLIIGIGINVNIPSACFPPSIRSSLTSLLDCLSRPVNRVQLLERLLLLLDECYHDFLTDQAHKWFSQYYERCESIGATVTVTTSHGEITGKVLTLDSTGALQIQTEDEIIHTIPAGEVIEGTAST